MQKAYSITAMQVYTDIDSRPSAPIWEETKICLTQWIQRQYITHQRSLKAVSVLFLQ